VIHLNECRRRRTSGSVRPRTILYRTLVLAFTVLVSTVRAQPANTALMCAVATANARKAEVEQYVKEIKNSVRPPDPTYAESRRLYFLASSLNNDFMNEVLTSFAHGRTAAFLSTKASEVQLRVSEFTEYACTVIFGRRRSIGEFAHASTMIIDVATDQKHAVHINRHIANALLTEVQWRSWADIN
jgi:hypothetical protein